MPIILATPFNPPPTIPTSWSEQFSVDNGAGAINEFLGNSVAINSDDGTTMAVSYPKPSTSTGTIDIYVKGSGSPLWTLQASIVPSDHTTNSFLGSDLALSADGNVLVVGDSSKDDAGSNSGAVYIFRRTAGSPLWAEEKKLLSSNAAANKAYGTSVDISSDGNTVIVGENHTSLTYAYIYTYSGGSPLWSESKVITADDNVAGSRFGNKVAINSSGTTAIVGAFATSVGGTTSGAAYVFNSSVGSPNWVQENKLISSNPETGGQFGASISISDNDKILIGAPREDVGSTDEGNAYIFEKTGGSPIWVQTHQLNPIIPALGDQFGQSCKISKFGDVCVIGASGYGASNEGALYMFTLGSGSPEWTEAQRLDPSISPLNGGIGSDNSALDMYGHGNTIVGGARLWNSNRGYVKIWAND